MNGGVTRFARGNRNKAPSNTTTDASSTANTGAPTTNAVNTAPTITAAAAAAAATNEEETSSFPMLSLEERPNTGGSDGFNLFKYNYGAEDEEAATAAGLENNYYLGATTTTTMEEENQVNYASFSLDDGEYFYKNVAFNGVSLFRPIIIISILN